MGGKRQILLRAAKDGMLWGSHDCPSPGMDIADRRRLEEKIERSNLISSDVLVVSILL